MTSSPTAFRPPGPTQWHTGSEHSGAEPSLGLQHGDRTEISRLLQAVVDTDAIGASAKVQAPLALLNACPLATGTRFGSHQQAAAAIDLSWRSAMSAIHLLGHRVAKTAVSTDIDLHGVFHPLWRQTLTLSFASELTARVTGAALPRPAWLAGLTMGLAGLNSAIRLARLGNTVTQGQRMMTSASDLEVFTKHFELDEYLPPAVTATLLDHAQRPWNVATTAACLLKTTASNWQIDSPRNMRPAKMSPAVVSAMETRIAALEQQSAETCNALWRCPMRSTGREGTPT